MNSILCDICIKPIDGIVFGRPGENICGNCHKLNRNKLFSDGKRTFYSDRIDWNTKAREINQRVIQAHTKKPYVSAPEAVRTHVDEKWHSVSS